MEVLLCAARLRQSQQPAGIVSVGNRQGNLQPATELALDRAAFMGVAVVRVARDGMAPAQPSRLFVAAGTLSAIAARALLQDCLARFGAPPAALNPLQPTAKERAAISVQLARFQQAFDAVQPSILVAVR
ncbi:MAG: hypothetical protein JWM32_3227 [Verrucomicrobia bacterium]|nr:hypothetical protein [Verrucomicrobiota bacterium]